MGKTAVAASPQPSPHGRMRFVRETMTDEYPWNYYQGNPDAGDQEIAEAIADFLCDVLVSLVLPQHHLPLNLLGRMKIGALGRCRHQHTRPRPRPPNGLSMQRSLDTKCAAASALRDLHSSWAPSPSRASEPREPSAERGGLLLDEIRVNTKFASTPRRRRFEPQERPAQILRPILRAKWEDLTNLRTRLPAAQDARGGRRWLLSPHPMRAGDRPLFVEMRDELVAVMFDIRDQRVANASTVTASVV